MPATEPTHPPLSGMLPLEPMDPRLTWIQPGSGVICRVELAWGRWRRFWLRTFRPGYVRRMAALRKGDFNGCPHPVLDPRDLKYFQNQGGYHWEPQDDPFRWRDRLPFARVGLAELLIFSLLTFGPAAGLAAGLAAASEEVGLAVRLAVWLLVAALTVCGLLVVWFFRDPPRRIPQEPGMVVSPADGTIVAVDDVDDEFVGPAVRIGIFLSIFSVHLNRAPVAGRVIGLRYQPGKYLNALRPESARENEQLAVRMQETTAPHRRYVIRQITGAIARRIVCWLKPGDDIGRGERFGMIKLGSRTELVLPRESGLVVRVRIGAKVRAGSTVMAHYAELPEQGATD